MNTVTPERVKFLREILATAPPYWPWWERPMLNLPEPVGRRLRWEPSEEAAESAPLRAVSFRYETGEYWRGRGEEPVRVGCITAEGVVVDAWTIGTGIQMTVRELIGTPLYSAKESAPKFAHSWAQAPNLGVNSDRQKPTTTDIQPEGNGSDEPKSL